MRVVHINKQDTGGGAAVAARRIHHSLREIGVDSHMLVLDHRSPESEVHSVGRGILYRLRNFWRFVKERLTFLPNEKSKVLRYYFSLANTGMDISQHPQVQKADVINLHWINQGMLGISDLQKLFALGKPIVWTLHDMWPFTGGCHYAGSCLEFNEHCGFCPLVKRPTASDVSTVVYKQKKDIYKGVNMNIVTCSNWLGTLAQGSSLFRSTPVTTIPNPIDFDIYTLQNRNECRKALGLPVGKKLILFGAANIMDIRKGYRYLYEALQILNDNFPTLCSNIELVVFGKTAMDVAREFNFKVNDLSFVRDASTLVKIYNAADVFVLPSLQDNLPNTVMECMACGTPVVGFRIGGVPEMIEHGITGYLAEIKNSLSLANGINAMLFMNQSDVQRNLIRQKSIQKYRGDVVANKYLQVYEQALQAVH